MAPIRPIRVMLELWGVKAERFRLKWSNLLFAVRVYFNAEFLLSTHLGYEFTFNLAATV